ncbi:MAG: alanyl-tRNA editing protein [Bryobacteraceae bacterium]|nr:alanyl-tRNA editing protein [Bryobacteraceae bacterium]
MTERIYYNDSYQTEFRAHVLESSEDGRRLYLDRTAFYPASGGQPHDTGCIDNAMVTDVIEEEDGRIAHILAAPVEHPDVDCRIDWARRFDHMQQHSGQHLLSAVLMELFSVETLSFHLGDAASTIDLSVASLEPEQLRKAEARANEIVFENRPLAVEFRDASENLELRKPSERQGKLRIVTIEGLDRSGCCGTHVRSTG